MFVHLREYSTDIEMDFAGVGYPQAFIHGFRRCIETGVFKVEGLFKVIESVSEFVGFPEETGVVIVSYGLQSVVIFGEELCFLQ